MSMRSSQLSDFDKISGNMFWTFSVSSLLNPTPPKIISFMPMVGNNIQIAVIDVEAVFSCL